MPTFRTGPVINLAASHFRFRQERTFIVFSRMSGKRDFAAIRKNGRHQRSRSTADIFPVSYTPHCRVNSRRWYTAQHFEGGNDRSADKPDLHFPSWDGIECTHIIDRSSLSILRCSDESGPSRAPQRNPTSERRQCGQTRPSISVVGWERRHLYHRPHHTTLFAVQRKKRPFARPAAKNRRRMTEKRTFWTVAKSRTGHPIQETLCLRHPFFWLFCRRELRIGLFTSRNVASTPADSSFAVTYLPMLAGNHSSQELSNRAERE